MRGDRHQATRRGRFVPIREDTSPGDRDGQRTFVAVPLPDEVRRHLIAAQDDLRRAGGDVRWVGMEQLHVTIQFLGNVRPDRVPEVSAGAQEAAEQVPIFDLTVQAIGAFPTYQRPRTVWAGIQRGDRALKRLAQAVEEALKARGFPPDERPFRPHVTLGRVRPERDAGDLPLAIQEWDPDRVFGNCTVNRLLVMKSDLTPTGPVYTLCSEHSLAAAAE